MNSLTPKQQLFVHYYCQHWNGKKAAIAAGYPPKSAQQVGSENLFKPVIKEAIDEQLSRITGKVDFDAESVVQEIGHLAFANIKDCYDENGELIPINELPRPAYYP